MTTLHVRDGMERCGLRMVSRSVYQNAVFGNCNLSLAVVERTLLEGADLRTAYNFSIDPENNRIKKAKFSMQNIVGLMDKYGIFVK
ncbi:MAG: hypothetical protein ACKV1O_14025 [Saprospiraceae bacterium]